MSPHGQDARQAARPPDPLDEAEALLRQGQLADAARLFRAVLAADPTNPEALTGLAREAMQRGSLEAARPLLARASAAAPRDAATFAALAQLHSLENRLDDAEACLRTAAALRPDHLAYRVSLAALPAARGDVPAALAGLLALADGHPGDAALFCQIGVLHLVRGAPPAARDALERALASDPGDAEAWHCLGQAHAGCGDVLEAMSCLRQALAVAPAHPAALAALAELLLDSGDASAAERLAREGALVAPDALALPCLQGRALLALGRIPDGLELLARTVRAAPAEPLPLLSLADGLLVAGEPGKAVPVVAACLALPSLPAAPRRAAAGTLLRAGQVDAGWAALAAALPADGPLTGTLRLVASRTLADTLFFARLCPLLAAQGGSVRLSGAPALMPLLGGVPGLAFADDDPDAGRDGDLLRLGALLAPSPGAVPPLAIAAPPGRTASWRGVLATRPRPWIAVAWGGPTGLALADVLAAMPPDATPVSIVTGAGRDGIAGSGVVDAGEHLEDYAGLAALLAALDAVLLPDGPAAHLAGAMGRPGAVFAPPGGHMAWAAPWYPALTVLRHWTADAARAALGRAACAARDAGPAPCSTPAFDTLPA